LPSVASSSSALTDKIDGEFQGGQTQLFPNSPAIAKKRNLKAQTKSALPKLKVVSERDQLNAMLDELIGLVPSRKQSSTKLPSYKPRLITTTTEQAQK
jgi:hypothetical protein